MAKIPIMQKLKKQGNKSKYTKYVDYTDEPFGESEKDKEEFIRIRMLRETGLSARSDELTRWKDNIERQSGVKTKEDVPGKSNIRIPLEGAIVESKTSDEVDTLGYPLIIPTEPQDNELSNIFQVVYDYVINNIVKLKKIKMKAYMLKNTLGDVLLKVYWKTDKQKFRNEDGTEEIITVYDDIFVEIIDPRNFILDPIAYNPGKDIDDAKWCGFYSIYGYKHFQQLFGNLDGYKNIDKVPQGSMLDNDALFVDNEEVDQYDSKYVEVYEHWDIVEDKLTTVANNVIIRETPIPYYNPISRKKNLPISHYACHLRVGGFWNYSDIDVTKDLIDEYQTMRNINLDSAKTYTHPILVVGRLNDLDVDDMQLGNGFVWQVDDINQVKHITMGGNTGVPFSLEGANRDDMIRVTGHDLDGVLGSPGQTATQTLEKKESAIKRIRYMNSYNEMNGDTRLYMLIKDLILLKYSDKRIGYIVGKNTAGELVQEHIKNAKKSFKIDYDIQVVPNNNVPASNEIKKLRNQELLANLVQVANINPEKYTPMIDMAVKRIIEENLQMSAQEIEQSMGSSEPKEEAEDTQGQAMLEQELERSRQFGMNVGGGGGMEGKKNGTAKSSQGVGVQENIQPRIQNMIG